MSEPKENTIGDLKLRLSNMLINTVALSEALNVLRDACVSRAGQIIDSSNETELANVKAKLEGYEAELEKANASGPSGPTTGPVEAEVEKETQVVEFPSTGPSGDSGPSGL